MLLRLFYNIISVTSTLGFLTWVMWLLLIKIILKKTLVEVSFQFHKLEVGIGGYGPRCKIVVFLKIYCYCLLILIQDGMRKENNLCESNLKFYIFPPFYISCNIR